MIKIIYILISHYERSEVIPYGIATPAFGGIAMTPICQLFNSVINFSASECKPVSSFNNAFSSSVSHSFLDSF